MTTTPRTGHPVVVIERGSPGRDVENRYALPETTDGFGVTAYRRLRQAFYINSRFLSRIMLRYPWGCYKRAGIRTMNSKPDGQEHKGNSFDMPLVMIENNRGDLAEQIVDDIAWMADHCDEVILYHGNCNGLSLDRVRQAADYLRMRLPDNVRHAVDASSSANDVTYNSVIANYLRIERDDMRFFCEPLVTNNQRIDAGNWPCSVVQSHHLQRNLNLLNIKPHAGHRILIQLDRQNRDGVDDLDWFNEMFGSIERALAAGWDVGLRPHHLEDVPDSVRDMVLAGR